MFHSRIAAPILLLMLIAVACERTPVEPIDAADEFALAVLGPALLTARPAPFTLPGLLHAAVHRVYVERGAAEARALVAELSRLQEAASQATQNAVAESDGERLASVHREQLRIVLTVFGTETPARVIAAGRAEADRVAQYVKQLDAAREDIAAVTPHLVEAGVLLDDAEVALQQGAVRSALDYGTRAASVLAAAHLALAESLRVPGINELFALASGRIRQRGGDSAVRTTLSDYQRLQLEADAVIRAGDRVRAHSALQAVRAEQIRIILDVFGAEAPARMLDQARAAAAELQPALRAARARGNDISKLERMHAVSRDMLSRASGSLAADDLTAALDLGGHAVTLINGLRLALAAPLHPAASLTR